MAADEEIDLELLEAAKKGIAEYLSTTRGSHFFGANATVEIENGRTIYVRGNDRLWTIFSD